MGDARGMTSRPQPAPEGGSEPLFARVLCGIDGSPAAEEAARQAAVLTGGGSLELVSVTWTTGAGPTRMTALGETRARRALQSATVLAAEHVTHVSAELLHAADVAASMLRLSAGHDLIAVGARTGSRAGGIMLGSLASRMAHEAEAPVLIARRPPEGRDFPEPILLATDGSDSSKRAAALAARIAGRLGAEVMVLRVGPAASVEELRELARQTAAIVEATGREPAVIELAHRPHETIVKTARSERASLIVLGSRGRGGAKALTSTSERVAHQAPCSVLVARS